MVVALGPESFFFASDSDFDDSTGSELFKHFLVACSNLKTYSSVEDGTRLSDLVLELDLHGCRGLTLS